MRSSTLVVALDCGVGLIEYLRVASWIKNSPKRFRTSAVSFKVIRNLPLIPLRMSRISRKSLSSKSYL